MFATKQDAINWIKDFSKGLQLEPRRHGKYWAIYNSEGIMLSDAKIAEIETAR